MGEGQNSSVRFTTLLEVRSFPECCDSVRQVLVVVCCGLENWDCGLKGYESSWRCHMIGCVCVTVPHALFALSSLQGNRCQQSCAAGFYHEKQEGACLPCHKACATCAGKSTGQGAGVRKCMKNFRAHGTEPFSVRLCVLKACLLLPHCGIRCRCRKMQPLCRRLLDGGVEVCALVQCRLLRHRAKPRDSWWAQDM